MIINSFKAFYLYVSKGYRYYIIYRLYNIYE